MNNSICIFTNYLWSSCNSPICLAVFSYCLFFITSPVIKDLNNPWLYLCALWVWKNIQNYLRNSRTLQVKVMFTDCFKFDKFVSKMKTILSILWGDFDTDIFHNTVLSSKCYSLDFSISMSHFAAAKDNFSAALMNLMGILLDEVACQLVW